MANSKKATHKLLQVEGVYVDHPDDPGGETAYGIAKEYWPEYWEDGTPDRHDAYDFYDKEFWQPLQLDDVHDQTVAYEIFEQAVNLGKPRAVAIAQLAYNLSVNSKPIAVDGIMGHETVSHLNRLRWEQVFRWIKFANGLQFVFYLYRADRLEDALELFDTNPDESSRAFLRGWVGKRVEDDLPKLDFSHPDEE